MTRGQLQLHGSPYPQPSCRPLARFDQLGPRRAPWWSHHSHPWGNNHKYRLHGRRGHCSPQWLVLHPLVMEALRPPPPSSQADVLRSRRTPVKFMCNCEFQFLCTPPISCQTLAKTLPFKFYQCHILFRQMITSVEERALPNLSFPPVTRSTCEI